MRVGLGTAALGRSVSRADRLRVLEAAYDGGVRHFDTAPLYGSGAAEEALGAFGHRDELTLATKVGIVPPPLARTVLGRLTRRPAQAASGRFSPADIRASLEGSLRRLRTSHVDLVLLHEVETFNDELLAELERIVERGDARRTGIATGWRHAEAILARGDPFPEVVQGPEQGTPFVGSRELILHSALVGREGQPRELLRAALDRHPAATILFGSRNPEHVRETLG